MTELGMPELDKLFCINAKKYALKKLLLKAVAVQESSMNQKAFRHEPGYWARNGEKILAKYPELAGRPIREISSSYGLMQVMFCTAYALGFRGTGEELFDPVVNIELGAKLIRILLDKVRERKTWGNSALWEIEIVLSTYNGGGKGNPDDKGKLRTQKYVDSVFQHYVDFKKKEAECDDED